MFIKMNQFTTADNNIEDIYEDIDDTIQRIRTGGADRLASDFVSAFNNARSVAKGKRPMQEGQPLPSPLLSPVYDQAVPVWHSSTMLNSINMD